MQHLDGFIRLDFLFLQGPVDLLAIQEFNITEGIRGGEVRLAEPLGRRYWWSRLEDNMVGTAGRQYWWNRLMTIRYKKSQDGLYSKNLRGRTLCFSFVTRRLLIFFLRNAPKFVIRCLHWLDIQSQKFFPSGLCTRSNDQFQFSFQVTYLETWTICFLEYFQ